MKTFNLIRLCCLFILMVPLGCELTEPPATEPNRATAVQFHNLTRAGLQKIYAFPASLGDTAKSYLKKNTDWMVTSQLITKGSIVSYNDPNKVSLTKVSNWVNSRVPEVNSTVLITIDWEEPFGQLQSQDSATYMPLVREYVKVVNKIKEMRPQAKVSVYGLPFIAYSESEQTTFNQPAGKFELIFRAVDVISPEIYLSYPETYNQTSDPQLNERFLASAAALAVREGMNYQKPVLPYFWYRVTTLSDQPEKGYFWDPATFARLANIVLTQEESSTRVDGLILWDQQSKRASSNTPGVTVPGTTVAWVTDPTTDLAYDQVVIQEAKALEAVRTNPSINLTFDGEIANTIADKNGIGTGFKMIAAYSGVRAADDGTPTLTGTPEYEPVKLNLVDGKLQLITNKGLAHLTSNNQINTLGMPVNSLNPLQLETTIIKPYYGTASQQAGMWFGLNDRTYVKLVVSGHKIELRKEQDDASASSDQRLTAAISGLNTQTVRLRLVLNPVTNTVTGYYSTNGTTYIKVGTPLNLSNTGLISPAAYAGIFGSHRNGTTPVTYTFDNFKVTYQ
ncbi:MAG: hypothetical protein AVDCRST_MAG95-1233 [uncultured Adhaeribacter sp.]|uniref:Uncharacterized protein n=1 Tax=uncultured Adhaeribacter sp. TaxID=448109 RepID=A0A6J4HYH3_9BACT|nr:MAG: hypothetical protein AVDCRST_MAG95-1233 [uncultured Adhaeribacter sp.]